MYTNAFIIDDYPLNLRIAEIIIKEHGFFNMVTSYLDADKALSHLVINQDCANYLPDVILLDINMPVMDGWQFLEKFETVKHLLKKEVRIFILSSSIDNRDIQRSKQYPSVKGFLSKPLSPDMLRDITDTLKFASLG